ncbi:hypothetical protein [Anaeromyxobacter paludicola]|uniref:Lipoprotein n=1 Tax=Anaeromyxobacter paludicola TaxID=2918171 RepID=A0ABM7XCL0_9BACT|nr:hypothetical protein [Anaeromyxobacter paludicola]BDG09536.1 hypothetical protein AMPC_26490 [Anaeromyxobacter paludicola]
MPRLPLAALLGALALLPAACRSRAERGAEAPGAATSRPPAPFDWSRPAASLAMDAGEVAARLGPFEWEATATWTVVKASDPEHPIHVSERHLLRQQAKGAFRVSTELDPGTWQGAETGRTLVFDGARTFARGRWSPAGGAFRARPNDRGEEARRHREESFGLAEQVARLCGPALELAPAGELRVLARAARRYELRLGAARPSPATPPAGLSSDDDTRRRLGLLEGRVPQALEGELVADAETGAPLAVHLRATFGTRDDPGVRVDLSLDAAVTGVGDRVPAVQAPAKLAPEPKAHGVARALEAVGLRKKGEPPAERAEPGEPEPAEPEAP